MIRCCSPFPEIDLHVLTKTEYKYSNVYRCSIGECFLILGSGTELKLRLDVGYPDLVKKSEDIEGKSVPELELILICGENETRILESEMLAVTTDNKKLAYATKRNKQQLEW